MIELSTAGIVDSGRRWQGPALDETWTIVEDSFVDDTVSMRATRRVSQEMYDSREGRLVIEMLVKHDLIGAIGRGPAGDAILAWLINDHVHRPNASWRAVGGFRVLDDGSRVQPSMIYSVGWNVPRSVLVGAPQTVE